MHGVVTKLIICDIELKRKISIPAFLSARRLQEFRPTTTLDGSFAKAYPAP